MLKHTVKNLPCITKYPLRALLWALIIQRIFSIPTDQLLLTFLAYSKPLSEFCGFSKVPDASKIARSKQDFLEDLQLVFDNLVDLNKPICQAIDSAKADTHHPLIHPKTFLGGAAFDLCQFYGDILTGNTFEA